MKMFLKKLHNFSSLNFKYHLLLGLLIRILFVIYGTYQDATSTVPYTDIDYKVFTDASRHMLNNRSPYARHTYRYPPLLAMILIPNLLLHHAFGKFLFCLFDILVAILIKKIVETNLLKHEYMKRKEIHDARTLIGYDAKQKRILQNSKFNLKINYCVILWLYNPMTITISTRGNCDAIPTFLVLLTLYLLQNKEMYFLSGIAHGLSVYMRLYPLIYSLTIFLFLSNFSLYSIAYGNSSKTILNSFSSRTAFQVKKYLIYLLPNLKQLKLIAGFFISLSILVGISYHLYGYDFLHETYLYHINRKDIRHNFSLYFYLQYLSASINYQSFWLKFLMVCPQLVLLIAFSFKFGLNKLCLNFSILLQTIVFVVFNSVLTSQYFVWIIGILPLCVLRIKIPTRIVVSLAVAWVIAQLMWLVPAYYLEFKGHNTFLFIWFQCVSFYCINIAILGRFIKYFV
ncbi:hypothetical protein AMK59_5182 [Oryctes borbonicus]|uniref:GPI alpha-1,4-mannosyltransferase I, catalytic subunit n=1 Tax=Oryctes borbonicus TaxID=1629725 RepID=A0A0T6B1G9_9SCAR|nr:hypothetical protein AMK59_5182 [Oryctes borbonicus]